jgi:flagellar biosynthetic protein FlhB
MALKTHEPTAARLRRAEQKGDVPHSSTATRSLGFALGVLLLPITLAALGLRCLDTWQQALTQPISATALLGQVSQDVALIVLPWLAAIALATTLITLLQTRGYFRFGQIAPQVDRLRPDRAWSNALRGHHWLSVLLALMAALLIGGAGVYFVVHQLQSFAHSAERPLAAAPLAIRVAQQLAWVGVGVGLVAGLFDWLLRRSAWQERQRMTHAEWLEDQKTSYGDPAARAERKRLQREQLSD